MIWLIILLTLLIGWPLLGRRPSLETPVAIMACLVLYELAEYIQRNWPDDSWMPADSQEAVAWLLVGVCIGFIALLASPEVR